MNTVEVIQEMIDIFSPIPDEEWCVLTENGPNGTHCAVGHLRQRGKASLHDSIHHKLRGENQDGNIDWGLEAFNDSCMKEYQQPTPKARVLAALHDLLEKEQTQPAVEEVQQIVNNPKIEVYETV